MPYQTRYRKTNPLTTQSKNSSELEPAESHSSTSSISPHSVNDLEFQLSTLKESLASFKVSAKDIEIQWEELRKAFICSPSFYKSFQEYALESLDLHDLRHIIEVCEKRFYEALTREKNTLIKKLTEKEYLGLDWWALYFWFGREIIKSRTALKILLKIGKATHKCRKEMRGRKIAIHAFTYENIHDELMAAKAKRKPRRGVSNDSRTFTLDDMTRLGVDWMEAIDEQLATLKSSPPSPELGRGNSTHIEHNHDDEHDDSDFRVSHDDLDEENSELEISSMYRESLEREEGIMAKEQTNASILEEDKSEYDGFNLNINDDQEVSKLNILLDHDDSFELIEETIEDGPGGLKPIPNGSAGHSPVSDTPGRLNPPIEEFNNSENSKLKRLSNYSFQVTSRSNMDPSETSKLLAASQEDHRYILTTPGTISGKDEAPFSILQDVVTHRRLMNDIQQPSKWTDDTLNSVLESFKYPTKTRLIHPLAFSSKNFQIKQFYEYDTIFLPIHHLDFSHWTLAVVKPQENSFKHYDSLRSTERNQKCSKLLSAWIERQMRSNHPKVVDCSPSGESPKCAQQSDEVSCGLFVATFVYRILNDDGAGVETGVDMDVDVELMRGIFAERLGWKEGSVVSGSTPVLAAGQPSLPASTRSAASAISALSTLASAALASEALASEALASEALASEARGPSIPASAFKLSATLGTSTSILAAASVLASGSMIRTPIHSLRLSLPTPGAAAAASTPTSQTQECSSTSTSQTPLQLRSFEAANSVGRERIADQVIHGSFMNKLSNTYNTTDKSIQSTSTSVTSQGTPPLIINQANGISTTPEFSGESISFDIVSASAANTKLLYNQFEKQQKAKRELLDVEQEENKVKRRKHDEGMGGLMKRLQCAELQKMAIEAEQKSIEETFKEFIQWERLMPGNVRRFQEREGSSMKDLESKIQKRIEEVDVKKRENQSLLEGIKTTIEDGEKEKKRLERIWEELEREGKRERELKERAKDLLRDLFKGH